MLTTIVVEDGSFVDNHRNLIETYPNIGIRFLRHTINQGPGYCRNVAAEKTESDYIWFLDSDAEISRPNTLQHLIDLLTNQPTTLMAGGSIERVDNTLKIMEPMILPNFMFIYRALPISERYETIVPFLSTCNMFMRRSDYLLVGGFDPSLKMFEDNEFCFHLKELKDGHFHQDLDTLVFHAVSPTGRDEGVFDYFKDRNRYFRILLSTRTILLARYQRWRLLALPFLDLISLPVIFVGRLRKEWALSRIKQTRSTSRYKFACILLYLLVLHHILALRRFFTPS